MLGPSQHDQVTVNKFLVQNNKLPYGVKDPRIGEASMSHQRTPKELTIAVSTLGKNPDSLRLMLEDLCLQTNKKFEVVIVVQSTEKKIVDVICDIVKKFQNLLNIRVLFSWERGLLKSRNIALESSEGNIVWFSDDDCRYNLDSVESVINSFYFNYRWDIITFNAKTLEGSNKSRKRSKEEKFKHGFFSLFSVCSIEIAVRKRVFNDGRVMLFDERYGLGTRYETGGENIMLTDLFRRGYVIGHVPKGVVIHPRKEWPENREAMSRLAFSKGAMFRRIFGRIGIFFIIAFVARQFISRGALRYMYKHPMCALNGFLYAPK